MKITVDSKGIRELNERLAFLKGEIVENAFLNEEIPWLQSQNSGAIDENHTPTWFTKVHDILEELFVVYSEDEIQAGHFLDFKVGSLPSRLHFYLISSETNEVRLETSIAIEMMDIRSGTFKLETPIAGTTTASMENSPLTVVV